MAELNTSRIVIPRSLERRDISPFGQYVWVRTNQFHGAQKRFASVGAGFVLHAEMIWLLAKLVVLSIGKLFGMVKSGQLPPFEHIVSAMIGSAISFWFAMTGHMPVVRFQVQMQAPLPGSSQSRRSQRPPEITVVRRSPPGIETPIVLSPLKEAPTNRSESRGDPLSFREVPLTPVHSEPERVEEPPYSPEDGSLIEEGPISSPENVTPLPSPRSSSEDPELLVPSPHQSDDGSLVEADQKEQTPPPPPALSGEEPELLVPSPHQSDDGSFVDPNEDLTSEESFTLFGNLGDPGSPTRWNQPRVESPDATSKASQESRRPSSSGSQMATLLEEPVVVEEHQKTNRESRRPSSTGSQTATLIGGPVVVEEHCQATHENESPIPAQNHQEEVHQSPDVDNHENPPLHSRKNSDSSGSGFSWEEVGDPSVRPLTKENEIFRQQIKALRFSCTKSTSKNPGLNHSLPLQELLVGFFNEDPLPQEIQSKLQNYLSAFPQNKVEPEEEKKSVSRSTWGWSLGLTWNSSTRPEVSAQNAHRIGDDNYLFSSLVAGKNCFYNTSPDGKAFFVVAAQDIKTEDAQNLLPRLEEQESMNTPKDLRPMCYLQQILQTIEGPVALVLATPQGVWIALQKGASLHTLTKSKDNSENQSYQKIESPKEGRPLITYLTENDLESNYVILESGGSLKQEELTTQLQNYQTAIGTFIAERLQKTTGGAVAILHASL